MTSIHGLDIYWLKPQSSFWDTLWLSPEFQKLAKDPNSWLQHKYLPLLKSRPLGWFVPPSGYHFYFSAWLMNAVMIREYTNPLIRDLYILHEALHASTLDSFFQYTLDCVLALRCNEIQVSLETEVFTYIREPTWIGKTFSDLWISQPHIQQKIQQYQSSLPSVLSSSEQQLWQFSQHHVFFKKPWSNYVQHGHEYQFPNYKAIWFTRRLMNTEAQSSADNNVAQYDRLAFKWLKKIQPRRVIGRNPTHRNGCI